MQDKPMRIARPFTLGLLLLVITVGISACTGGSRPYQPGLAYDPYYHDNRYRNGVFAHHVSYLPRHHHHHHGGRR